MNNGLLFGVSLTASFLAGMLALMAPCCITFLFPAYLGTIFKENRKVVYYTLIFALGLASILVPVALGFRYAISLFDEYHKQIYYLGALVMIFMGIMTVKPVIKLPHLNINTNLNKKVDTVSVFILGVFSGLTSACCAPVLFAAITLTALSPTMFQALIVSMAYVLGIVFPLLVLSIFYEKLAGKISGKNRQKTYEVLKNIGAVIFIGTGIIIAAAAYFGKIQMYQMQSYSDQIRVIVYRVSEFFRNPILDMLIFGGILAIFIILLKRRGAGKNDRK